MEKFSKLIFAMLFLPAFSFAAEKLPECTEKHPVAVVTAKQPEFIVRLSSNPTTGYRWFLKNADSGVTPMDMKFLPSTAKKLVGAPGEELWHFRISPGFLTVPRQFSLQMVYARAFEAGQAESHICEIFSL